MVLEGLEEAVPTLQELLDGLKKTQKEEVSHKLSTPPTPNLKEIMSAIENQRKRNLPCTVSKQEHDECNSKPRRT